MPTFLRGNKGQFTHTIYVKSSNNNLLRRSGFFMGGRDSHNSNSKNFLAQTPKNQISDGRDIEFSRELADADDVKAIERSKAADQRAKQRKNL